ncbi:MAG: hypothetical protein JHC32_04345 [Candidatus Aminicenantes bacterium]|jgi:hypothetical protein|nr:hypothetical protein [Candidatus Aminicenantes bacterium]
MEENKLISFLQQAEKILQYFLPVNSLSFFPLLYASLIWALKRQFGFQAKVLELEVWLEPDILKNKPNEFVLNFFNSNEQLRSAYADELAKQDWLKLRADFEVLYPVIGLSDPFLEKLFWPELNQGNYRQLVRNFDLKLSQALSEIKMAGHQPQFWNQLEKIGQEFISLGWNLLNEAEARAEIRRLLDLLKK